MKYIKHGKVKHEQQIVLHKNGRQIINPNKDMLLEDGWEIYEDVHAIEAVTNDQAKPRHEVLLDLIEQWFNDKCDIDDNDAFKKSSIIYDWSKYIDKSLKKGQIVSFGNRLYRAENDIDSVSVVDTPHKNKNYVEVRKNYAGTIDDPIKFSSNQFLIEGKYYKQGNKVFYCTKTSTQKVRGDLKDFVGKFVNTI